MWISAVLALPVEKKITPLELLKINLFTSFCSLNFILLIYISVLAPDTVLITVALHWKCKLSSLFFFIKMALACWILAFLYGF
jgi:hypothetical protein